MVRCARRTLLSGSAVLAVSHFYVALRWRVVAILAGR